LIPSSGGVFEIVVDKNLIYSKKATGVFPAEGEILAMLDKE
jgi:selT/selW/selH-like putative selenoprotein